MLPTIALLVLTGAATPAHHQQAASALYQVSVNYNAYGLFQGRPDAEGSVPMTEHTDGSLTIGSAFAISPDGWLITAGHVVNPAGKLHDLCQHLSNAWPGSVMLRHATLTMLVQDIAGNSYGIVVALESTQDDVNLCIPGIGYAALAIGYDETMTARIVALDSRSDLALLKLDVSRTTYLPLAPRAPDRWTELFAVGYTDPNVRTTVTGAVARRCEEAEGDCTSGPSPSMVCPMVNVMRTTAAVQDGMSGSPQVSGGAAVGITTMRALDVPVGFAVPSTYALKWYRSVRWPKKYRRPTTVCIPTPEP